MANLYHNKISLDKKALSVTRNDFNQAISLLFIDEGDDYDIDFHEIVAVPPILKASATNQQVLMFNPDSNFKLTVNEHFDNRIGKLKPHDFFEQHLKSGAKAVSFTTAADFMKALTQTCLSTDDMSMEHLLIRYVRNAKDLHILPFCVAMSVINEDFDRLREQETGYPTLYDFEKARIGCSNSADVFGITDNNTEFGVEFYTRSGAPTVWLEQLYSKIKAQSKLDLNDQLIITHQFFEPQLADNGKSQYQGDNVITTKLTPAEINVLTNFT